MRTNGRPKAELLDLATVAAQGTNQIKLVDFGCAKALYQVRHSMDEVTISDA